MSRVRVVWDTASVVAIDAEPGTPPSTVAVVVRAVVGEQGRVVSGGLTRQPRGWVPGVGWRDRWQAWCPLAVVAALGPVEPGAEVALPILLATR